MGSLGVKLGAAPDAPLRGPVLAYLLSGQRRNQRRPVASTDSHPPPYLHPGQGRTGSGGKRVGPDGPWVTVATGTAGKFLGLAVPRSDHSEHGEPAPPSGLFREPSYSPLAADDGLRMPAFAACEKARGWHIKHKN